MQIYRSYEADIYLALQIPQMSYLRNVMFMWDNSPCIRNAIRLPIFSK